MRFASKSGWLQHGKLLFKHLWIYDCNLRVRHSEVAKLARAYSWAISGYVAAKPRINQIWLTYKGEPCQNLMQTEELKRQLRKCRFAEQEFRNMKTFITVIEQDTFEIHAAFNHFRCSFTNKYHWLILVQEKGFRT